MSRDKILLIERDTLLAAPIASTLEDTGLEVIRATSGVEGIARLLEDDPDVVIMSDELLSMNAKQIYRQVLEMCPVPVIVLDGTGSGTVAMLEAGADACMVTPPHLRELVARVYSLLRRRRMAGGRGSTVQGDPGSEWKTRKGVRGAGGVSHTEFRLLSCLMRNEGSVVENARLMSEVWGEKCVTDQCLRFYIRRLRQKIPGVFGEPGQIVNQRGVGYLYCDSDTSGRDGPAMG